MRVSKELVITLVQQNIIWENKKKNLTHLDKLLSTCKDSNLIILPELFTLGFTMNVEPFSEKMNGETVEWMKNKSKEFGCYLLGSMIVNENNSHYNRLIVSAPDADIFYYDKRHLFTMGEEDKNYAKGIEKLIFTIDRWRICPLICYDLRFPVWSRNNNEYDILIYIANWPAVRQNVWRNLLISRAIENQCYCIGVNRVGIDGKNILYIGESCVIDAKGNINFIAPQGKESVNTAILNYDELINFRKKFPVLSDRDSFSIKD